MERSTPVRKSHSSTADLLVWPENPASALPASDSGSLGSRPRGRTSKPAGGVGEVVFGGQLTEEEAESVTKRKPCSDYKLREITGSGIFANGGENGEAESESVSLTNRTGLRLYQQAVSTMSQISFSEEESVAPKKPISLAEVAKQRELSGNLEKETDIKLKKQISDAKSKELSGHDIFGPPEIPPKSLAARTLELKEKDMGIPARRNTHTAVKVSHPAGGPSNIIFSEEEASPKSTKKIHNQKLAELSGNNIFKGDEPPESAERHLSSAKLREMSGSDIFADGKAPARDHLGGVRKPPGGESSIALI